MLTRTVRNPFMTLFDLPTSTIHARAVARCVKPGYGSPAVLALSNDPEAITFNGGSSQAVNIVGDVVSHGGIDPNGNASHFQITGAAYSAMFPAPPNLTTTNGNYGSTSGVSLLDVPDPIVQGLNAQPPTIAWPNFATLSTGTARICDDPFSGNSCHPDPPGATTRSGSFTVGSSKYAKFAPGRYDDVTIRGDAEFAPGVYSFNTLDLGSQGYVYDNGAGVLIHIRGPNGLVLDVSGGAEIDLSAKPGNTWRDIVLYVPNGDIDLTGNGEREINGTVYAPNGEINISGNGGDAIVNGQVIGHTINFSGNGPAVSYDGGGAAGTFGPILVNPPD